MLEIWRQILYPLGFIAQLAFGLRFLVQWIESEKAGKSIVKPSFWRLSFLGNLFLAIHTLIQAQFFVCLIQSCNALISWRNLNLQKSRNKQWQFRTILFFLFFNIVLTTVCFVLINGEFDWFRVPVAPWQAVEQNQLPFFWHLLGMLGYFLFSSRFWVQWWIAEKLHASVLTSSFWWISLIGALLSIFYFARIGDLVNLIGPAIGLIPYIRNIMLMSQSKQESQL